jgi:hypothetical protein
MSKWVARFTLPIICGFQLVVNLRLAPEASPRVVQQIFEQTNGVPQIPPSQIKVHLDLSTSAASSLLLYNLVLSAAALLFSLILFSEEAARHRALEASSR